MGPPMGPVHLPLPLFHAMSSGNTDMVTLLLENGADPNITMHGITPLLFAARWCPKNDFFHVLLNKGADPDKVMEDGPSPVFLHCKLTYCCCCCCC